MSGDQRGAGNDFTQPNSSENTHMPEKGSALACDCPGGWYIVLSAIRQTDMESSSADYSLLYAAVLSYPNYAANYRKGR